MKFICPLVVVEDIKRSRFLYEEIMGQKVKADFGENITFEGDFALHQRAHFKGLINDKPVIRKSNSFELYFEEDELEPIVNKLEENGFEFVHTLCEQPWRQKVVRFYDYDKNMIEIGERLEHTAWRLYQEGLALEEISRITYLSEEAVEAAVDEY